jgi:non-heme chloroperoxidase
MSPDSWRRLLLVLGMILLARPALAADGVTVQSQYFETSDGVRLHYLDAGPPRARTIILVPGWTMPAWIWGPQINAFSVHYHVVAFDPRGQGDSEVPYFGYEPTRRGEDIAELVRHVSRTPVVIVAWSLGVLDTLAYLHKDGDAAIAGLVLVDNSIGEEPAPLPVRQPLRRRLLPRELFMRSFVRGMFRKPQSQSYLDLLTAATLRTPQFASSALLSYPVPRTYWREAVYMTMKPILYVVRPVLAGQAATLIRHHPAAESAVFADAGHALFIDDAFRFNGLVEDFIERRIWR